MGTKSKLFEFQRVVFDFGLIHLEDVSNFTESQICLSDLDENNELNILDIVIIVQAIISG